MDIPDIKFKHPTLDSEGIEIINLNEFYHRKLAINHNSNKPHRVHFYLMLHIEHGEGMQFIDFKHYPFAKGSFIFINKNQIQAFSLHNKIQGTMILFTQEYIDQIQANIRVSVFSPNYLNTAYYPIFTPSSLLANSCLSLLSEIKQEVMREDRNSLIIMLLFSSLFIMLEREKTYSYINKLSKPQINKFNRFMLLLEMNCKNERESLYYSTKLHITYKTLNNLSKLATNQTIKQLIDAHVIIEVKRCLILDNQQVQKIAYDFNFGEVSNFVKYFRKHTAMTPLQFKKQTLS